MLSDNSRSASPERPISIELLGEPKGKGRPRSTRAGNTYTPAATRSHEDALRLVATRAMRGRTPLEGPLRVVMLAYFGVPRSWSGVQQRRALDGTRRHTTKPDADNLLKMLDALNKIVWRDDSQISVLEIRKHYSDKPRTRIEVIPL